MAEEQSHENSDGNAEECIICLSELPNCPLEKWDISSVPTTLSASPNGVYVATLPCRHYFHNQCLENWCEVANTCPLCRIEFFKVDVYEYVGGPWLRAYPVEEKVQAVANAEVPPEFIESNELTRCVICGGSQQQDVLLLCDGCDDAYHTFCLDLEEVPENEFYCPNCVFLNNENVNTLASRISLSRRRRTNGRAARASRVSQRQQRAWTRAWNTIRNRTWENLNSNLSYYTLDTGIPRRNEASDLLRRRIENTRLRSTSNVNDEQEQQQPFLQTPITSESERKAWSDFDVVLHSNQDRSRTDGRSDEKRSIVSPDSSKAADGAKKLKRPVHRNRNVSISAAPGSSSNLTMNNDQADRPSVLANLVNNINRPSSSLNDSQFLTKVQSILKQSQDGSSSNNSNEPHITPLFSNLSPQSSPPLHLEASSPSSHHVDESPGVAEPEPGEIVDNNTLETTTNPQAAPKPSGRRELTKSPRLPYEVKYRIERLVNAALKPHYRNAKITKEQFAVYNKKVSRSLYSLLSDGSLSFERTGQYQIANEIRERVDSCIRSKGEGD